MASSSSDRVDHSPALRSLMAEANIASYRALSQTSGVPRSAIDSLRQGQIGRLRVDMLQRLCQTLGLSLETLIDRFSSLNLSQPGGGSGGEAMAQVKALRQECDRLQTQLKIQADTVRQQVQQEAIAQLEPWLVQWPTAAHAAQQKVDLPAQKLLPLVRPVETLVQSWGVTPIETVGAEVSYDPQIHQPKTGVLSPGQPVRVSHVGYRQGDRLLYRAKVAPIQA